MYVPGRVQEYRLNTITGAVLNALIARYLFDVEYVRHDYVVVNGERLEVRTWLRAGESPDDPPAGTAAGDAPPLYDMDMEAAMDVVSCMNDHSFYSFALFRTGTLSSILNCYMAVFRRNVYPPVFPMTEADDKDQWYGYDLDFAARAICRAALKVIRHQETPNWKFDDN